MHQDKTGSQGRLILPEPPASSGDAVKAWAEPVLLRTYLPELPYDGPIFLEKRVYQGSSGRVYPLPVIDRIATEAVYHAWQAVHLENEFLRLMILPEIGGRIHVGLDKTNGYDFFYRQNVIKPALVGLAGPWISGGVEFNWPQHHRPATFMPVSTEIERHADGSVTVWCGDYDRMSGMRGMHGVCLHPGKAYLELKVRLYNCTAFTQTFLWWANAATRVHEHYQSFFPNDVHFVADHARRAISHFPECDGSYYGVNYSERARNGVPKEEQPRLFRPDGSYAANDLSWYANIPVPTSYMILGTESDFFGGYDHRARAGVVHVANHHIAPGKKQWTWGNHDFGYAWDRSLTDDDGPYIELMAGVYTDNQPDFSFIAPGETRTFSQYWYPIREIGPPQAANLDVAIHLDLREFEQGHVRLGIFVTSDQPRAEIRLEANGTALMIWQLPLSAGTPLLLTQAIRTDIVAGGKDVTVIVRADGREILRHRHQPRLEVPSSQKAVAPPQKAVEPPLPKDLASLEELYLTGLHLEQYRHATRSPEPYWQEALHRDPLDSRANNALGLWHLRRGEFSLAEEHLRRAITRLTRLNPNPRDGETFYNLGLTLRFQSRYKEAYDALYKATWSAAWRSPAYHALAEIDSRDGKWQSALTHLELTLRVNADNLKARNLAVVALRMLGRHPEAETLLAETRRLDPLDSWSRNLERQELPEDNQQRLQLAFDYMAAGLLRAGPLGAGLLGIDALEILASIQPAPSRVDGAAPIALYALAWCHAQRDEAEAAAATYARASEASPAYCFPHRLEEMLVLEAAIAANPWDARAPYYLGNLLYDKRRHREAIACWEQSARLDPTLAALWRNLGFAYFNIIADQEAAVSAFNRAFESNPQDARILFERDQLWKRIGISPRQRLSELQSHAHLLQRRDDLVVELATLHNQLGKPQEALALLTSRRFQPWEGGEGLALAQYLRAHLALGRVALATGDFVEAQRSFLAALDIPENLGEARHLLANQAEVYFWLGTAFAETDRPQAMIWWERAAGQQGDFQQMSVHSISAATFWSAQALKHLGRQPEAEALLEAILAYSRKLAQEEPVIDYFATSLPAMLLFEEDLCKRYHINALFLAAQASYGLAAGRESRAKTADLLRQILAEDINHMDASLLLRNLESDSVEGRKE